ncbi:MAG: hypothetical protein LQ338_003571 [Usnochroma carphineum]|nr:MAG: hypothetical protein LQ338_003571 [Usnochroma carphineum]
MTHSAATSTDITHDEPSAFLQDTESNGDIPVSKREIQPAAGESDIHGHRKERFGQVDDVHNHNSRQHSDGSSVNTECNGDICSYRWMKLGGWQPMIIQGRRGTTQFVLRHAPSPKPEVQSATEQ